MNKRQKRTLYNCIIIAGLVFLAWALDGHKKPAIAEYSGQPSHGDGDSFELQGFDIRLYGIDAPELDQTCMRNGKEYACGVEARNFLHRFVRNSTVQCEGREIDHYDRVIAECSVNGKDLAAEIVRAGWAVSYLSYGSPYLGEEAEAENKKRGIWAGDFQEPKEFRDQNHWTNLNIW